MFPVSCGNAFAGGWFFRPIEERQKQLEQEPQAQAEIDFLKVDSFSADQVMKDATYLQEVGRMSEKGKIVECITNKIVVSKGGESRSSLL